jgi:nucleoside 2-deoxyribosyltransferase
MDYLAGEEVMTARYIYLGGPIMGHTESGANDWRREVDAAFSDSGADLYGVSPLRCEPLHGKTYQPGYPDPRFGTARAIASKNLYDCVNCDMAIINIPKPPEGLHHSWGTMAELGAIRGAGKQAILVSDDPEIRQHPVLNGWSGWVVETLEEAVDICVGILGGYAGGKNV